MAMGVWARTHVPPAVAFQEKWQLGLALLDRGAALSCRRPPDSS
jgi:hypothetical protein